MKIKKIGKEDALNSGERLIEIFEYIIHNNSQEVTIDEIANVFNISKSSSYRMLNILFKKGYLDHKKGEGKYLIGFKILEIAWVALSRNPLAKTATPYIEKLVNLTGESATLAVLQNNQVFYVAKSAGSGVLKIDVDTETRSPVPPTALGKVLLAWFPNGQLKRILRNIKFEKYTPHTIVDKKLFLEELKKTREKGFAIANEEYYIGSCAIAVPLRNKKNEVIASLAIVLPKARFTRDRIKLLTSALFTVSAELETKLSYLSKSYLENWLRKLS
jgi:IclR family KDG regulon transcriptional repressor